MMISGLDTSVHRNLTDQMDGLDSWSNRLTTTRNLEPLASINLIGILRRRLDATRMTDLDFKPFRLRGERNGERVAECLDRSATFHHREAHTDDHNDKTYSHD
jgi:hypothetical protein